MKKIRLNYTVVFVGVLTITLGTLLVLWLGFWINGIRFVATHPDSYFNFNHQLLGKAMNETFY